MICRPRRKTTVVVQFLKMDRKEVISCTETENPIYNTIYMKVTKLLSIIKVEIVLFR